MIESGFHETVNVFDIDNNHVTKDMLRPWNGVKSFVCCVSIRFVNLGEIYEQTSSEHIVRLLNILSSLVYSFFSTNKNLLDIRTVNNNFVLFFSTTKKRDLDDIFTDFCAFNTAMNLFNLIAESEGKSRVYHGIGVSCDKVFFLSPKMGKDPSSGFSHCFLFGNVFSISDKLMNQADSSTPAAILVDQVFYNNISDIEETPGVKNASFFCKTVSSSLGIDIYSCHAVISGFQKNIDDDFTKK